MDVLSEVLRAVRLTGAIFFDMNFSPPFVGESPNTARIAGSVMPGAEHVISFHVLLEGSCWAEIVEGDVAPVRLDAGDVVVFPMGDANALSSSPGLRQTPDLTNYYRPLDHQLPFVPYPRSDAVDQTRFVCGYFGCDARPFNPLLAALPRMLVARHPADSKGWVAQLVRLAVQESETRRSGGETILAKVSELMFVEVVRDYIDTLPQDSRGWCSGLRDQYVGKALRLIHARPADVWTIDRLAHEVGLSRSAFAKRFVHFVGLAPMHYLGCWRMQIAARLLEGPNVTLAQAGAEVGYDSEAAFNRAFKKFVGAPPGSWRKGHTGRATQSLAT